MLEVKDIYVNYGNVIFDHTDFRCGNCQITAISGNSGKGKTTLLDIISLNRNYFSHYYINHDEIDKNVLKRNMYYSKQEPIFEENLKMRENLDLLYRFYDQEKDPELEEDIIKQLELEHTLDMYVNSLSAGERKRFSLLVAIVTKRKIVLLDEPTASIDKDMREKVIEIIVKYLRNNMTIISTHDKVLLDKADVVYTIENAQLCFQNSKIKDKDIEMSLNKTCNLDRYYWKTFKHKKLYFSISQILSVLVVSILIIGLFSIDAYVEYQKENLNLVFTNQFIVYSPLTEQSTYEQNEYPLTDDQLNQLKQMNEVKSVRELYCISQDNGNKIKFHNQSVFNDEETNIQYVSYDHTRDNQKYINTSYNDSGIYISKDLASKLNNINKGDELTFSLPVPQYNVFNEGYVISNQNDITTPSYYIVYPKEHNITVTLPIAGVLEDNPSKLGMTLFVSSNTIYIPQNIYQKYIDQYKVSDTYQEGKVEYKPYVPNAYVVELHSINDVAGFKDKITDMGLGCDSEYFDIYSYIQTQQSIKEYQRNISIGITVGMIIVIFVLKYLKRKEENSFFDYIKRISLDNQYTRAMQIKCLFYRTILTFLLSLILSYGIILILSSFFNQNYNLTFMSFLVCFIFSLCIEFISFLFSKSIYQ